ncbi:methyl-accepting chemotaxis protein [Haloarcula marina]|uniref:methyl-accepting chemotaxis protein n=1 Tax=Haloarcula marina TaxID=2961574 RepID=UPI0020B88D9D|nr:methyl-accepting chemotaxis protein [Halomicroarcula marina]
MVHSIERGVVASILGQFGHALYQALVLGFAPSGVAPVLSVGGLVAAGVGAAYSLHRFSGASKRRSARLATLETENESLRTELSRTRTMRDELVGDLRTARASPMGADGRTGRPDAPVATTDGGVTAQSDVTVERLNEYLADCCATLDAASEGDLRQRMNAGTTSDAMNDLATEFNEMADAFEQTIDTAAEFSDDVAGSSEQVTAATEAVKEASESVAGTVQEIADVFHEQHQQISTISEEMSEMSATIEEIAASSNEVTEMADKTERRTVEGIEAGRDAHETMVQTVGRTDDVVETVQTLNQQMTEVGKIVDLIDNIAEQTNILALNASIEAAHASSGAENNGFGVVADEVKSLAEETKDATNQIEDLIEDIQDQTDDAVDEIIEMQESVEDGQEAVGEGLEALESIMEHVQETSSGVKEISNATDDQAATSEEVASIADDVAETSRKNVEEAEHVAAIAEEQNLALGEMYVNVRMLTMRAQQLSTLFERYETED